ncbi:hypothetical protein CHLNCDRAFT_140450 [Chlorella variabilis]|uniref:Peroxisomal nicotinamide adenine dinucleotide carrier n=1 Tax=Chlorella variabilis TaxID=554065 RepID=E1Z5E7_CHLVA|nr:hypothetical protein CHLNCDRAFT_140450 [Chlorella variabilis]EFN58748.1 hypothetical protein CHLNCDRAFT_140450 [Chlorella variabilis]|eukprot:XP_005850850.1 hypothetical protein CHLNCDRAFT_140450 [Chlorella variabilis]
MPPSDAAVEGVSGAIGGIVATCVTYPLMTVNTLQAIRARTAPQDVEGGAPQRQPHHRGTLQELAEVVRTGGWQALFSGLEASLVGTTISQGIYFYLYSLLRRLAVLRRVAAEAAAGGGGRVLAEADIRGAGVTVAESLAVAALAGMGNVLLKNPIWMVATRMQAQGRAQAAAAGEGEVQVAPSKPGIVAVARQVYSEYGVPGFWNGTAASLVMVVNPTLQYALYEWLQAARARLRQQRGGKAGPAARATALEVFLLSALAKAGATLVTYPMMNIKTRMYTARRGDGGGGGGGGGGHHSSILRAAAEIARTEGVAGYYRGLRTKVVQSVLAAALLFVAKEKITEAARDLLQAAAGGGGRGGARRAPKAVA